MLLLNKTLLILICITLSQVTNAQNALAKAESYAQLDAPFLSIKYLQKHISKKKDDRSAMRLLANTYLQVNMVVQGQKWLLKANNSPAVVAYFKQRNEERAIDLEETKSNGQQNERPAKVVSNTVVIKDRLLMVNALGVLGCVI